MTTHAERGALLSKAEKAAREFPAEHPPAEHARFGDIEKLNRFYDAATPEFIVALLREYAEMEARNEKLTAALQSVYDEINAEFSMRGKWGVTSNQAVETMRAVLAAEPESVKDTDTTRRG